MTTPKAYIFDVFGTLVDWRESVARECAHVFDTRGLDVDARSFADAWRGEYQPAMERIRSGGRGYIALDDLHLENLDRVLATFGLEAQFDNAERAALNRAWEKLDPWPDVVEGLNDLKEQAIIAPCSNGSIALMTRLAKYGGLPWDCILGAEIAKNYKPEREVYLSNCAALRLNPADVMMVAAHNDDLVAARDAGLRTAFIARPTEYGPGQSKDLEPNSDWDRLVETIGGLAVTR
ncbi:MAG: haloacid dehalogenase type II [Ahrensia sp.]|nr:haloacid dehalogenase type II [Ahrensia sp.]